MCNSAQYLSDPTLMMIYELKACIYCNKIYMIKISVFLSIFLYIYFADSFTLRREQLGWKLRLRRAFVWTRDMLDASFPNRPRIYADTRKSAYICGRPRIYADFSRPRMTENTGVDVCVTARISNTWIQKAKIKQNEFKLHQFDSIIILWPLATLLWKNIAFKMRKTCSG